MKSKIRLLRTLVSVVICISSASSICHGANSKDTNFLPAILILLDDTEIQVLPEPPEPDGVFIQLTSRVVDDHFGDVSIVGEIFNNTDSKVKNAEVTAFFESSGNTIALISEFAKLMIIPPRSKTCFKIGSLLKDDEVDNVRLHLSTIFTTFDPIPNVIVTDVSERIDVNGASQKLTLIGKVINKSASAVDLIRVVSTVYSEDGSVLDCDDALIVTSTFQPESTTDFIVSTGQEVMNVGSYTLQTTSRFEIER